MEGSSGYEESYTHSQTRPAIPTPGWYTRSLPHHLDSAILDKLAEELKITSTEKRPKGRPGLLHDRRISYLKETLANCTKTPGDSDSRKTVSEGSCVAVRFEGDSEHRTYFLAPSANETGEGARDTEAAPHSVPGYLSLPGEWPLAKSLIGARVGEAVTHTTGAESSQEAGSGSVVAPHEFSILVMSTWTPEEPVWRLTAGQEPPEKQTH